MLAPASASSSAYEPSSTEGTMRRLRAIGFTRRMYYPNVFSPRTNELTGCIRLDGMADPADRPADRKERQW